MHRQLDLLVHLGRHILRHANVRARVTGLGLFQAQQVRFRHDLIALNIDPNHFRLWNARCNTRNFELFARDYAVCRVLRSFGAVILKYA